MKVLLYTVFKEHAIPDSVARCLVYSLVHFGSSRRVGPLRSMASSLKTPNENKR
jgi:hypothetical protein